MVVGGAVVVGGALVVCRAVVVGGAVHGGISILNIILLIIIAHEYHITMS